MGPRELAEPLRSLGPRAAVGTERAPGSRAAERAGWFWTPSGQGQRARRPVLHLCSPWHSFQGPRPGQERPVGPCRMRANVWSSEADGSGRKSTQGPRSLPRRGAGVHVYAQQGAHKDAPGENSACWFLAAKVSRSRLRPPLNRSVLLIKPQQGASSPVARRPPPCGRCRGSEDGVRWDPGIPPPLPHRK